MSKTPTDEHTTEDLDDAPAERMTPQELRAYFERICGGTVTPEALERAGFDVGPLTPKRLQRAGFERVREYECTGGMLAATASIATEHARRNPGDEDAQGTAAIVKAIEIACEAGDSEFIKKLAGKADHYLRYDFVKRPRTRSEEADMLWRRLKNGIDSGATNRELANSVVTIMRILPKLAIDTRVPLRGARVGAEAREAAVDAVENAFELVPSKDRNDPEALSRAAFRALGCPADKAKNLFSHRDR